MPNLPPILKEKQYLGDAVYVKPAGWGTAIWLTTEDGISETNKIMLEPEVLRALEKYLEVLSLAVKNHLETKDA